MGQLISSKILGAVKGLFSALDATDVALLANVLVFDQVEAHVTDGGTAATAQTETFLYKNTTGTNQLVTSAVACTPIAVTGSDTTNATFTVTKRSSVGGTAVVVATYTTSATPANSMTAFLPVAMPLTAANAIVAPNEILTVLVSKLSTGVAIAAATSQARIQVQLTPTD